MTQSKLFLVAGAVAGISLAAPALAQTKLVVDAYVPPKHPFVTGIMKPFSADVKRVTSGRVLVELSASPLSSSRKQWEAVDKGISDIAVQYTGWQRQRIKLPAVAHLPFGISTAEKASVGLWRTQQKFFSKANEFKGMKLLGFTTHAGNQITTAKQPITSVADLKGQKIRSSTGEPTQALKMLGGVPVTAPGPKIFEFISKGVVDGVMDGSHAPLAFRIVNYIKHSTQIPGTLGAISFAIYMNGDKWNGLSAGDKAAIDGVAGEVISGRGGKEMDDFSGRSVAAMKKAGVKFHQPSDAFMADLKKMLAPLEANWLADAKAKGIDGPAALAFYRQQVFN